MSTDAETGARPEEAPVTGMARYLRLTPALRRPAASAPEAAV
ncbi:hypothetical protein AB0M95_29525 [Sphaerisporangium sp. NPDC051017]